MKTLHASIIGLGLAIGIIGAAVVVSGVYEMRGPRDSWRFNRITGDVAQCLPEGDRVLCGTDLAAALEADRRRRTVTLDEFDEMTRQGKYGKPVTDPDLIRRLEAPRHDVDQQIRMAPRVRQGE